MSSEKLERIINKYPKDRKTISRLDGLISESTGEGKGKEYTFEFLVHKLSPSSPEVLALILAECVQLKLISKVVRVESPSNRGGIGDFPSVTTVPSKVHDWRVDEMLAVTPEDLRVIFKT